MNKIQIVRAHAREILDSRGNPTVEASVLLSDGSVGVASVPSGASVGKYEACELRDEASERYGGRGVLDAVYNVNKLISPAIAGICAYEQAEIDNTIIMLDSTKNKSKLGANATLSVSLAAARAAAVSLSMPLYKYIGGISASTLPIPMMNILNGGVHASNNIDIQEFMIMPTGAESFCEGLRIGAEIYSILGKLLKRDGHSTSVGDEGGFAPNLDSDEQALDYIVRAIEESGYEDKVKIALDVASSGWLTDNGNYYLPKRKNELTAAELIDRVEMLCDEYPIASVEDGIGETDFDGWTRLTERLGSRVMLVGDDLFVTNTARLRMGIEKRAGNAILIKPNQIGTLTETLDVIALARRAGYSHIISHRSGETDDTTIADIAVATGAMYIKSGAPCRGERVAKYNRLLKIESSLLEFGKYGQRNK
ncbi:MAG: phosphopyruvate hydratase [Clostridia bacterium]|nr:phosphopyruvate hydratase [Clostridia bacterium]